MLDHILNRIDYTGRVAADVPTLQALHRAWRTTVPYENLDIQLGRPIHLDRASLVDKLIHRRRGGYCFEQNGGLELLLRAAGFDVTMVEGAVQRADQGDSMWGNHNALLVTIEGQGWLADAGIGDGFLEPLPLQPGTHRQDGRAYQLEQLGPATWRMHHHEGGSIRSYDFGTAPKALSDFQARSHQLSTAPDSVYVATLVVGRTATDGTTSLLLSRTVRTQATGGTSRAVRTLSSIKEFSDTLRDTFLVPVDDLGPVALEQLWQASGHQDDLWRARVESASA